MQVVFLPMCYPNDVDCARDVAKKMQNESVLIRRELSAGDTHALIAGSVLVLSQRLHALIFALSQHVPAVGITYDIKVQSFLEYAEKPYFVSFDDCTVSELLQQTERAVADTSNDGVQHICARERLNVDFARALLSNGPDIPRERLDDIY
jgi:polysaccharide pyruvyl transferase WcaK-like protein